MPENKKSDGAKWVLIIVAIIAILIFIWWMMRPKPENGDEPPVPDDCPEGTTKYMHLELYEPNPQMIWWSWYDQIEGRNNSGITDKEPMFFIPAVNQLLSDGRITPVQRDCAMLQYDAIMNP